MILFSCLLPDFNYNYISNVFNFHLFYSRFDLVAPSYPDWRGSILAKSDFSYPGHLYSTFVKQSCCPHAMCCFYWTNFSKWRQLAIQQTRWPCRKPGPRTRHLRPCNLYLRTQMLFVKTTQQHMLISLSRRDVRSFQLNKNVVYQNDPQETGRSTSPTLFILHARGFTISITCPQQTDGTMTHSMKLIERSVFVISLLLQLIAFFLYMSVYSLSSVHFTHGCCLPVVHVRHIRLTT